MWLPSQGLAGRNHVPGAVFRGEAAHVREAVAVGGLGDGVERRVGLTQVLADMYLLVPASVARYSSFGSAVDNVDAAGPVTSPA
jgi:hypothetical protein